MKKSCDRKSPRVTVNHLVGETTGGKYFLPLLANISEKGILIESPAGLERPRAHDPVVELNLPGCPNLIWARCRLVRQTNHGFFQSHALEFLNISAVDRKHIRLYVQRCAGLA
jgi:c-di-GMP-binding flagellar brake protein YcgR